MKEYTKTNDMKTNEAIQALDHYINFHIRHKGEKEILITDNTLKKELEEYLKDSLTYSAGGIKYTINKKQIGLSIMRSGVTIHILNDEDLSEFSVN